MGLTDASFQFYIKSTTLTSHFYKLVLLIIIVITLTQILLNMGHIHVTGYLHQFK